MGRKYKVGLIVGDGIGPEVISEALKVLEAIGAPIEFFEIDAGLEYFKRTGRPVDPEGLEEARKAGALLKGPLTTPPGPGSMRSVNVFIRKVLDLYANVRPFTSYDGVSLNEFDLVIVRENTEGLYSGVEGRAGDTAFSIKVITRSGSERVIKYAIKYAVTRGYGKITAVHKANILKESDGLFRQVFRDLSGEARATGLDIEEMFVDAAAYWLVKDPSRFGVIVTTNLYGDILSDLAAGLVGSLGLCGSAQIGEDVAVFEPVHGSAPDIAGKGIANPVGAIMATAYMLEYLGLRFNDEELKRASHAIKHSVRKVIESRTSLPPDLGGHAKTNDIGRAIASEAVRKMTEQ